MADEAIKGLLFKTFVFILIIVFFF